MNTKTALKELRTSRDYAIKDFSKILGISLASYYAIESGRRGITPNFYEAIIKRTPNITEEEIKALEGFKFIRAKTRRNKPETEEARLRREQRRIEREVKRVELIKHLQSEYIRLKKEDKRNAEIIKMLVDEHKLHENTVRKYLKEVFTKDPVEHLFATDSYHPLSKLMVDNNLSYTELEKVTGVTSHILKGIINGHMPFTVKTLFKILDKFDFTETEEDIFMRAVSKDQWEKHYHIQKYPDSCNILDEDIEQEGKKLKAIFSKEGLKKEIEKVRINLRKSLPLKIEEGNKWILNLK